MSSGRCSSEAAARSRRGARLSAAREGVTTCVVHSFLTPRSLGFAAFFAVIYGCSATKDAQPGRTLPDGSVTTDAADDDGGGGGLEIGTDDDAIVVDAKAGPLRVDPTDAVVMLPGGNPATVPYTLSAISIDGTLSDITPEAKWSLEDVALGSFAGNTLTAKAEGKTKVRATARGMTVETNVEIRGPVTIVLPGAPGDAGSKFGGTADATRAPKPLYPSDGIIVPPNMNVLEFHFEPGSASNTLFELSFLGAAVDVKVYFNCTTVGAGCVYAPDATVWKLVAEGGRGGEPIAWSVRGVNGASPGAVGASASRKVSFGQEDLTGGLYYWNAGAGATMRYEFGVSGKKGETFINGPQAGATFCVGCHALSRDGKRIALGLDFPSNTNFQVRDVATKAKTFSGAASSFYSFNPDATQLLTSNGVNIGIRDAATGAVIKQPLVPLGTMPDWSPDGARIVYAKPKSAPPVPISAVDSASLEVISLTGSTWGAPKVLVPFGGKNNFYPSWSPDGAFVLFNQSPSNMGSMDSSDAPTDARVFLVKGDGGTPIELTLASTGGDSWPKWMPRVQSYRGRRLMWLTFSSRRQYGLRLEPGKTMQLWMTAIDPAKANAGEDPSWPAFWLPFQDLASGNHIAQWVTKVERKPCSDAVAECASGEQCIGGVCRPVVK